MNEMPQIVLPSGPALVTGHGRAAVLTEEGELLTVAASELASILNGAPPLLIHAPATFRRLGIAPLPCLDLLHLFAFARPARSAAPTPRGLALALDEDPPETLEAAAALLPTLAATLLRQLATGRTLKLHEHAAGLAARMGRAGWPWAPYILAALGQPGADPAADGLRVWRRLPQWEDQAPPPAPGSTPVGETETRRRLATLLGTSAEERQGQSDYAAAAASAFAPREAKGDPRVVLAEAGTGTGKTLGYLAPASLWAERNGAPVWISTYTRHLQRQVQAEAARLADNPAERRRRIVVRKGRENYLCLLNYEERVNAALSGAVPASIVPLGLVARWALATAEGDVQGGDLPGWFPELFGPGLLPGIADRRGECIHGACPHYQCCLVEHTIRRARSAEIVIANHALTLAQAAWGGLDDDNVPVRYVFDEGHQLFDAADAAFAAEISGIEGAELRRWLLGAEGGSSRARGLRRRLDDLVAGTPELETPRDAALLAAAQALPGAGWRERLAGDSAPAHPFEAVLRLIRNQVLARADPERGASECALHPPVPGLAEAAESLARALDRVAVPLKTLSRRLAARLDDEADALDTPARRRIEAACRSLKRRAIDRLEAWAAILRAAANPAPEPGFTPQFIYYLRFDPAGREASLHRHWLDPTIPFATSLAMPAHGLLVTSATLRDAGGAEAEEAWRTAEARIGALHLPSAPMRVSIASPFDYARQTLAFIITDVTIGDPAALAAAFRTLFLASNGGGLGLFTAIGRLRAVHARLAPALEAAGIPLLAQHVDAMDNATLVDIFRTETESCLLGTDAMRDGVDVPGRALRLVVFERVPWPRPDLLHRERRTHLAGGDPRNYDDAKARLRLRQAFGRLVRARDDRGVFVLLDPRTPSRLLSAFPDGVRVERVGLAEAAARTRAFLLEPDSRDRALIPRPA